MTHMRTLVDFDVCLNGDQLPHFASVWHFLCQEAYPETAHAPQKPSGQTEGVHAGEQESEQIFTHGS